MQYCIAPEFVNVFNDCFLRINGIIIFTKHVCFIFSLLYCDFPMIGSFSVKMQNCPSLIF